MLPLGQVRTGSRIILNEKPFEVIEANHLKIGRGGAKLVCKLRNYLSGAIIDHTFQGEDKLEEAVISFQSAQFLYTDNGVSFFMNKSNYEQLEISLDKNKLLYLKEGQDVDLVVWESKIIDIRIPKKVSLKVAYTEPGFKGDSVSATQKPAELETGAVVQVPLFVKTGDEIIINTETNQYDSRV